MYDFINSIYDRMVGFLTVCYVLYVLLTYYMLVVNRAEYTNKTHNIWRLQGRGQAASPFVCFPLKLVNFKVNQAQPHSLFV
jgi:hypothetical protein